MVDKIKMFVEKSVNFDGKIVVKFAILGGNARKIWLQSKNLAGKENLRITGVK